jgi:NTP pyrophosphatase (non-canonical NTP hydrolase)
LFSLQVENQRRVYVGDPAEFDAAKAVEYVHWNTLAAMDELMELLATWSWKPWSKNYRKEKANPEKVAGEVADLLCFVANIARAAGLSARDVMDAWDEKIDRNRRRQEQGYDVSSDAWKCPVCKEELDATWTACVASASFPGLWFCATKQVYKELEK